MAIWRMRLCPVIGLVSCSATCLAGNGRFDPSEGKFNFCVSVRFAATDAQLAQIRTAFNGASQILADATDGQHRFGTVTIVNNSGSPDVAEYWVNPGTGRAFATIGQYGVRGQHVNLYFDDDISSSSTGGPDGNAYTIAHEHSHHAYGVADEYSGPGKGGATQAECAGVADSTTLNYSLMDNYFTRGGRSKGGVKYTLNEFCVASNHDPDLDNYQSSTNHESCWETIAKSKFPATPPQGLPIDAPPPIHSVSFNAGTSGLRAVIVIDRSGSMVDEDRIGFAKRGATTFVARLGNGDRVGTASFSSSATTDFSLQEIAGAAVKSGAVSAINALTADGSTNIGGGLLAGLSQLTSQADRSCNEIIVLLSDGDHNTGTPPASVIPQLKAEGVTVFTVGVGTDISAQGQATLQDIAASTGGRYLQANDSFDIIGQFLALGFDSLGQGVVSQSPGTVTQGAITAQPVTIEAGVATATFALAVRDTRDDLGLEIVSPKGTVFSLDKPGPGFSFSEEQGVLVYSISQPQAGKWLTRVKGSTVVTGDFELLTSAERDGSALIVASEKNRVAFPELSTVHATLRTNGQAVRGAIVTGTVIRPDDSRVPVVFRDDGNASGGDKIANDGTYTAIFSNYNGSGAYTFEANAETLKGATIVPGESLMAKTQNTKGVPAPLIQRSGSTTIVVDGAPYNLDSDKDTVPDSSDTCPNSVITRTLVLGGCDTGVANFVDSSGCSLADRFTDLVRTATTRKQFQKDLSKLTATLVKSKLLSKKDSAFIIKCGKTATLPLAAGK